MIISPSIAPWWSVNILKTARPTRRDVNEQPQTFEAASFKGHSKKKHEKNYWRKREREIKKLS